MNKELQYLVKVPLDKPILFEKVELVSDVPGYTGVKRQFPQIEGFGSINDIQIPHITDAEDVFSVIPLYCNHLYSYAVAGHVTPEEAGVANHKDVINLPRANYHRIVQRTGFTIRDEIEVGTYVALMLCVFEEELYIQYKLLSGFKPTLAKA